MLRTQQACAALGHLVLMCVAAKRKHMCLCLHTHAHRVSRIGYAAVASELALRVFNLHERFGKQQLPRVRIFTSHLGTLTHRPLLSWRVSHWRGCSLVCPRWHCRSRCCPPIASTVSGRRGDPECGLVWEGIAAMFAFVSAIRDANNHCVQIPQ